MQVFDNMDIKNCSKFLLTHLLQLDYVLSGPAIGQII